MAYSEASNQTLPVSPAGAESPSTPSFARVIDLHRDTSGAPVAEPQTDQESCERKPRAGVMRRIAIVALAATSHLVFTGGRAAEAAPLQVATQVESQGSGMKWAALAVPAVGVIVGAITWAATQRKQAIEKNDEKVIDALKHVAGSSDAAQQQAHLNILAIYARKRLHKPKVFITAVQSLRARRSVIDEVREGLKDKDATTRLDLLDSALAKRRNVDREMLKLLTQTHPEVLKQLKKATRRSIIDRTIGR